MSKLVQEQITVNAVKHSLPVGDSDTHAGSASLVVVTHPQQGWHSKSAVDY
jgi:hypothetical protein